MAHGGQTTEKVSLTVFTEQSPQPDSFKVKRKIMMLVKEEEEEEQREDEGEEEG